jgi:GntR family transcriptional regulator
MLPFQVVIRPGESPYRQIVYAATKAVLAGELPEGSKFPSVRDLSQALRINPNTAHKAVAELVREGTLEVLPGVGTVIARRQRATAAERRRLLSSEVEQLAVAARRLGLHEEDVLAALSARWAELFGRPNEEELVHAGGHETRISAPKKSPRANPGSRGGA